MKKIKVYLLSLGCAKNLVNSEQMLSRLKNEGYEITQNPNCADIAIVNTCGFIDAAKSEAIESILQLAELKNEGLRGLIVTGCLSQRYGNEFERELPEADGVLGAGSYHRIAEAVERVLNGEKVLFLDEPEQEPLECERELLTPAYSAYLRIAEGCDNRCAYCVIPYIRGAYRSRRLEDIVAEAECLAKNGVRELIVVAQDITRYGTDIYNKRALPDLLSRLCKIDGIEWIRLHYLYPDETDDELLELCACEPKILHYFDLPIQHISDRVLERMNRRGGSEAIKKTFDKIRALMPDAVIRTSLIVGFPGETEEDFKALCDFCEEYKLERTGVFAYSQEEGTPAAQMPDQIPEHIKQERLETLYAIGERVMTEKSDEIKGKILKVLCTGKDGDKYTGRTYMDSPDVDGTVFFEAKNAKDGEFYNVLVQDCEACDLYGVAEEEK